MSTSSLRAGRAPVTLRVPFAASSVAVARQKLRSWLVEAGTSTETIDDARIVISELVANSVRHARPLPAGDIVVTWQVEPRGLEIAVTDGGSGTKPRTVQATSSALAGRGMAIVESLAVTWWSDHSRAQSTVHAVLAI
ncbi:ATP-binding protein [Nocardioides iriomotensis]|uniref:ATP-binding protein n=1 Tax=Nocardioides iriomotensis TaxID=715784 RepID=UPI0013ED55A9|nr:ATP-binding protein [Nocardioides iriomotensis]